MNCVIPLNISDRHQHSCRMSKFYYRKNVLHSEGMKLFSVVTLKGKASDPQSGIKFSRHFKCSSFSIISTSGSIKLKRHDKNLTVPLDMQPAVQTNFLGLLLVKNKKSDITFPRVDHFYLFVIK